MEKNDYTITRIVLGRLIDDLRRDIFNADDKKVEETMKQIKEEYKFYKQIKDKE